MLKFVLARQTALTSGEIRLRSMDLKSKTHLHLIFPDLLQPEISRDIVPTPEGCSEPPDGHNYVKITFDRTPVMSTYLVAIVLGDFEYISAKIPSDDTSSVCSSAAPTKALPGQLEIRVYTPPGKRNFGQHALTVAKKSLPFYADFFGTPYPLPKLDLVAIPDFACGAMENWGLVTYR